MTYRDLINFLNVNKANLHGESWLDQTITIGIFNHEDEKLEFFSAFIDLPVEDEYIPNGSGESNSFYGQHLVLMDTGAYLDRAYYLGRGADDEGAVESEN